MELTNVNQRIAPSIPAWVQLLKNLLSASEYERTAADRILAMELIHQKKGPDGRWQDGLAEATGRVCSESLFLQSLLAFWAKSMWRQYDYRMRDFPRHQQRRQQMEEQWSGLKIPDYLKEGPAQWPTFHCYGLGITMWLSGAGTLMKEHLPLLQKCLRHPEGTVADAAMDALGSAGSLAREALPEMMEIIQEKGRWRHPFTPGIAVARVVAGDSGLILGIAHSLTVKSSPESIAGVCATLEETKQKNPEVCHYFLELIKKRHNDEGKDRLLILGATWSKDTPLAKEYHGLAQMLGARRKSSLRYAAALALGVVGSSTEDAKIMVDFARDTDPVVRIFAHRAAAQWCNPPMALVHAAAADLGNGEACDGEPHQSACSALISWGAHSSVAVKQIATWIDSVRQEVVECHDSEDLVGIANLIEAMGVDALPLMAELKKLNEACVAHIETYAQEPSMPVAVTRTAPKPEQMDDLNDEDGLSEEDKDRRKMNHAVHKMATELNILEERSPSARPVPMETRLEKGAKRFQILLQKMSEF